MWQGPGKAAPIPDGKDMGVRPSNRHLGPLDAWFRIGSVPFWGTHVRVFVIRRKGLDERPQDHLMRDVPLFIMV